MTALFNLKSKPGSGVRRCQRMRREMGLLPRQAANAMRGASMRQNECAVCLETSIDEAEPFGCGHALCVDCAPKVTHCPLCRFPVRRRTAAEAAARHKVRVAAEAAVRKEECAPSVCASVLATSECRIAASAVRARARKLSAALPGGTSCSITL